MLYRIFVAAPRYWVSRKSVFFFKIYDATAILGLIVMRHYKHHPSENILCIEVYNYNSFFRTISSSLYFISKVHDSLDLDRVTRVLRMKQTSSRGESETRTVPCDVCKKDADNAVTFCVDCGKKMCQKHLEVGGFS